MCLLQLINYGVCVVSKVSLSFCSLLRGGQCGSLQSLLMHCLGALGYAGWILRGESNLQIWHHNSLYFSSVLFWLSPEAFVTSGWEYWTVSICLWAMWNQVTICTILCYSVLQLILAQGARHSWSPNREPAWSHLVFLYTNGCDNPLRKQKGTWATTDCIYICFNISWTMTQHLEVGKGAQNKV